MMVLGWLEWSVIVFFSGICIGSFLNVVIYRLPIILGKAKPLNSNSEEKPISLSFPASHCPHCLHGIRWYENIPLLSYLFLGGKCSQCKAPIPFRYFTVELATGLAFFGVWYWLT